MKLSTLGLAMAVGVTLSACKEREANAASATQSADDTENPSEENITVLGDLFAQSGGLTSSSDGQHKISERLGMFLQSYGSNTKFSLNLDCENILGGRKHCRYHIESASSDGTESSFDIEFNWKNHVISNVSSVLAG